MDGGDLYVGGSFLQAGGVWVTNIARWNGSTWSALGGGVSGVVSAIAARNGVVYAGGNFATVSGLTVNGIARWDGTSWSALGSGVSPLNNGAGVEELAFGPQDELFVAGGFQRTGLKPASFFGIWYPPSQPELRLGVSSFAGGQFVLDWPADTNRTYQVFATTNLSEPFTALSAPVQFGGTNASYTNSASRPAQFFRVRQLAP